MNKATAHHHPLRAGQTAARPSRTKSESPPPQASDDAVLQERASEVGRRLAGELRLLLEAIPPEQRSVRASAGFLKVDPTLCKKIIAAIKVADQPLRVLICVPGIEGLRRIAKAAQRIPAAAESGRALGQAVERFVELVRDCGGTHIQLQARISGWLDGRSATAAAGSGSRGIAPIGAREQVQLERLRRQLFQLQEAFFGVSMQAKHVVVVHARLRDDPTKSRFAVIGATVGYRARVESRPQVMKVFTIDARDSSLGHDSGSAATIPATGELVAHLSTSPLPIVTKRFSPNTITHIIDPAAASSGPVDVVTIAGSPPSLAPSFSEPGKQYFWYAFEVSVPVRDLVLDVYMDRELARTSIPSAAVVFGRTPPGGVLPWYECLPGTPNIEIIGESAETDSWPRHPEATNYLMSRFGHERHELVGYRIKQTYPLWGAQYRLFFDFSPPLDASSQASSDRPV